MTQTKKKSMTTGFSVGTLCLSVTHIHFPLKKKQKKKQDVRDHKHFYRQNTVIIWFLFYSQHNVGTSSACRPHHKWLLHGSDWLTRTREVQSRQDILRLHLRNHSRRGFLHHADNVHSGDRAPWLKPLKHPRDLERDLVTSCDASERLYRLFRETEAKDCCTFPFNVFFIFWRMTDSLPSSAGSVNTKCIIDVI